MDILEILQDAVLDSVKLIPFLFITYLIMEYIETKTEGHTSNIIQKSEHFGPLFGGIIGAFPQCGFSAAASNFYAGRVITLGTLIAIYLSTSDEMLPIFISEHMPVDQMLKIIGMKAVIGIIAGFIIDVIVHKYHIAHHQKPVDDLKIEELCEHEHCHCHDEHSHGSVLYNTVKSAFVHTLHIFIFILIFTLVCNFVIAIIGEDNLQAFMQTSPVLSHIVAGLIGLIPNCAASVIITELYLDGLITLGCMMSGLLVGAGVGLAILFRVNSNKKENLNIVFLLFIIGVICGFAIDALGIAI